MSEIEQELARDLGDMAYDRQVLVSDDTEGAIRAIADEFDTIRLGPTCTGTVSQALFGSLPDKLGADVNGTVVIARGPQESSMSIRQAIERRLEG